MKGFKLWRLMFDTLALVSGVLIHPSLVATASAQQSKPNILFILADTERILPWVP